MRPRTSVIMNCYNGERFLREAIESVLAQTCGDWEIVFWDNRSDDGSAAIFNSYDDRRFCYHLAETHTNLGRARQLAVRYARGDWIGFLDCDDLWLPDKLQRQLEAGEADPEVGLVYCRAEVFAEDGGRVPEGHVFGRFPGKLPSGRIFNTLIKGNFIPLPSILVRREALDAIGGFAGRYSIMEDYYLALNIARRYKIAAVQDVLCRYRVHGENASLRSPEDTFEDLSIVKGLYPDPRAYWATLRIIARHLKKCVQGKRAPNLSGIAKGLSS